MSTTVIDLAPAPALGQRGWTALTAVTPAVWGTTYIVTSELLPTGHPIFAAFLRALPAGLLALAISRTLPRGAWWWKAAVLGTLNIGAFFPLLFLAAERLPGGVAATLGASQPIVVALLAVAVLGERLSRWRLGWGLVGVIGVGLVVLGPGAGFEPVGVLAGIAGSASVGLGIVLTKRWGRPAGVGALTLAGWQLVAGGLVLALPTFLIEGVPDRVDGPAIGGYLWLGLVGGLLAYTLLFAGIRRLPVTATALLVLLSPLVAATLGTLLLGETFSPPQLAGFVLALTALVAGQLTPQRGGSLSESTPERTVMRIAVPGVAGVAAPTSSEVPARGLTEKTWIAAEQVHVDRAYRSLDAELAHPHERLRHTLLQPAGDSTTLVEREVKPTD